MKKKTNHTIDLHIHTSISDGTYTPGQVVESAKQLGLCAIAITDHDTIDGVEEAQNKAQQLGDIEVIAGTEITTDYYGSMHILGYYLNINDITLKEQLKYIQQKREERNERIVTLCLEHRIPITLEELEIEANGDLIGRLHIASLLMKKGIVKDTGEAFEKYLGRDANCYSPREKITPGNAIKIIKDNGGLAVLAHPVHLFLDSDFELKKLFGNLKDIGLDGIEVYHSDHSPKLTKSLLDITGELDLCVTGGSDFHGSLKPHVKLGVGKDNLSIPYDILLNIKQRYKENLFIK